MYAILAVETQRRIFVMEEQNNTGKYAPFIRLIVMGISFVATGLTTMFGWEPLPFTDEQMNQGLMLVLSVGLAIYNWYKNNAVTKYGKAKEQAGKEVVGTRQDFKQQD